MIIRLQPSIANATNIDTLLVATEKDEKMVIPPESLQDKIAFTFNNLSQMNLNIKVSFRHFTNNNYLYTIGKSQREIISTRRNQFYLIFAHYCIGLFSQVILILSRKMSYLTNTHFNVHFCSYVYFLILGLLFSFFSSENGPKICVVLFSHCFSFRSCFYCQNFLHRIISLHFEPIQWGMLSGLLKKVRNRNSTMHT